MSLMNDLFGKRKPKLTSEQQKELDKIKRDSYFEAMKIQAELDGKELAKPKNKDEV